MFKFEPAERCLYGGVSPAVIGHSILNEFLMVFGYPEIDYRVSVVLNERNIQFFYYYGESIDLQNARDIDKLIEVGAISLTNPKETGDDILKFPEIGDTRRPTDLKLDFFKIPREQDNVEPILSSFQEQFYNFPFLKNLKKANKKTFGKRNEKSSDKKVFENFRNFIQCCLLAFVFEFEDREESFSHSPLYDKVRDSLRNSDVYNLLSAKIRYTLHVPEKGVCYNLDEYSFKTRKFADWLMNSRLNKVISPYNYPNNKRKNTLTQPWFYDPEEELEAILEQNRRQSYSDSDTVLDDNLVLKIRDFLYSKHALGHAMVERIGKHLFACGQWIMAISSLSLLLAIILSISKIDLFDCIVSIVFPICIAVFSFAFIIYVAILDCVKRKKETNNSVKHKWRCHQVLVLVPLLMLITSAWLSVCTPKLPIIRFCFIVALAVLYFIFFSGLVNKNGWVKVFLPRILVAELAAWLTIGIAEDLVKSMLWIDKWGILVAAIVAVVILISVILFGEIKQHSPYLNGHKIIQRDLYIFNHALFFAMGFGIIMQVIFYDNLIRNSDVMASVVFNDYFDDANYYCQNLIDLDNTDRQYNYHCTTYKLVNLDVRSNAKSSYTISLGDTTEKGYIDISLNNQASNDSKENIANHNKIVEHYNDIVRELNLFYCSHIESTDKVWIKDTLSPLNDTFTIINDSVTKNIDSIKEDNQNTIKSFPLDLKKEISCIRRNLLKFNNYDTLMSWATIAHSEEFNTGSECLDTLTVKAIRKHNCCLNIGKGTKRIFPTLLIFHTLIVLVLAFVTQLLISDKTVTEPL
jgi:hypothetical protein